MGKQKADRQAFTVILSLAAVMGLGGCARLQGPSLVGRAFADIQAQMQHEEEAAELEKQAALDEAESVSAQETEETAETAAQEGEAKAAAPAENDAAPAAEEEAAAEAEESPAAEEIPSEEEPVLLESGIAAVEASSVFNKYVADFICDDNPATAWFEGADGVGVGESIVITTELTRVSGIEILPGYMKSENVYAENAVPEYLSFTSGGTEAGADVRGYEPDFADPKPLRVYFDEPLDVEDGQILMTIVAAKKGSRSEHTGISEIKLIPGGEETETEAAE